MPENELMVNVHRYLAGLMEQSEKQEFEHRLVEEPALATLVSEMNRVWNASAAYTTPPFDPVRAAAIFDQRLRQQITRRRLLVASAAAVLLVLVAVGVYAVQGTRAGSMQQLIAAERMDQRLQDGSRVELQSGACIRIPESFGRGVRNMQIVSGDVYFDIASDARRPFVIEHAWGTVRVLGTEFVISVDTLERHYELMVTEGKVTFQPQLSKEEIIVPAGTGLKFNPDTRILEPLRRLDENRLSRFTGVLTFIDCPVRKVVADLTAHYEVKIEIADPLISECLYTAPLPYRDVPVTVILDALAATIGANVNKLDVTHYRISGGQCR